MGLSGRQIAIERIAPPCYAIARFAAHPSLILCFMPPRSPLAQPLLCTPLLALLGSKPDRCCCIPLCSLPLACEWSEWSPSGWLRVCRLRRDVYLSVEEDCHSAQHEAAMRQLELRARVDQLRRCVPNSRGNMRRSSSRPLWPSRWQRRLKRCSLA